MAYRLAITYLQRALDMHLPAAWQDWFLVIADNEEWSKRMEDFWWGGQDFLTRLHEAGVANDQTVEVMNNGEEEEEEIGLSFHGIFSDVEDEEFWDSNEDGGDLDNHFHCSTALGATSMIKRKLEASTVKRKLDYDDDDETGNYDEVTSDGDDDDYVDR